jgi:hypothetical protein
MLEAITWTHYFSALAICLTLYYLGFAVYYYPKEIRNLLSGNPISSSPTHQQENEGQRTETGNKGIDPYEELETTVAELKGILIKAGTTTAKEQLFQLLHQLLSNHPGLRAPAFRNAITNFLSEHIPKTNRLPISDSDLELLWET